MTSRSVLYVLDQYPLLSETFVRQEVEELEGRGWKVDTIALTEGDASGDGPTLGLIRDWPGGLPLVGAHLASALTQPKRYQAFRRAVGTLSANETVRWRRLPEIARAAVQANPTWVHAHFGRRAAGIAWCLAELLDTPWSFTLHARDLFVENQGLEPKLTAATRVVTVCEYNEQWMNDRFGATSPTVRVICGVRVPDSVQIDEELDVLAVGRLVPKKGFDVLIEAVPNVLEHHPTARFVLLGDGPELDALARQADSLGVGEHVEFRGATDHAEVLEAMLHSAMLVLPARIAADGDRDSMPIVIKEAMARSVPVIGSDLVGIPEMIDETCGRLVEPESSAALADAIIELLDDRDLRRSLGQAGRARVIERFRLEDAVDELEMMFLGKL